MVKFLNLAKLIRQTVGLAFGYAKLAGLGIQSSVFWSNQSFLWSKDWFPHGQSFLKIDGIDSTMVDLLQRLTGSILSWSIFFKDWQERKESVDI